MAIVVYLLGTLGLNMYVSVVLQMVTGALLYYVMSRTLNKEDYGYVMNFVKEKFRH